MLITFAMAFLSPFCASLGRKTSTDLGFLLRYAHFYGLYALFCVHHTGNWVKNRARNRAWSFLTLAAYAFRGTGSLTKGKRAPRKLRCEDRFLRPIFTKSVQSDAVATQGNTGFRIRFLSFAKCIEASKFVMLA